MSSSFKWVRAGRRVLACALVVAGAAVPADAGVSVDTIYRSYAIGGTTEREIVQFMAQHPFSGDHGHAYANLKHRYRMQIDAASRGGQCRVDNLDVRIDFLMTLPRSANPDRLTASARASFKAFAGFAQKHEGHHLASFVDCTRSFVARARQMTGPQCGPLQAAIRRGLQRMDAECQVTQRAFDQQQSKAVRQLVLFKRGQ